MMCMATEENPWVIPGFVHIESICNASLRGDFTSVIRLPRTGAYLNLVGKKATW